MTDEALLAGAIVGVAGLIFDVVAGPTSAMVITACTVVVLAVLWLAIPLGMRDRQPPK